MRAQHFIALPLLTVIAGCAHQPPPAERHRNDLAAIDESRIHASVMDRDLAIEVPVQRLTTHGTLNAQLEIDLTNVATGESVDLGSGSVAVAQSDRAGSHTVVLRGVADGLERIQTGPMIINWRLTGADDNLYGRKSLFAALGNLDVQLLGPTELPATGTSPLRVLVRDPNTRAPIAGADVTAVLTPPPATDGTAAPDQPLFSARTDARGELERAIGLPAGIDAGSIRVTVTKDHVQVWTSRHVERAHDGQLYLGLDKTIYKPGQDIHLRLLALSGPDRQPVAGSEAAFEARDGRGNKVFRARAVTDDFGVAAATVPTDSRVNEGDWTFSAQVAGRTTQVTVPVQAYALPKMQVTVTPEPPFAMPGDSVRGHVSATYLFGEPVTSASVTLDARTTSGISVGTITGTTDSTGLLAFDLTVPDAVRSDALEQNGDTLLITATVVDAAGQTEQGDGSLPLAAAPLRVEARARRCVRAGRPGACLRGRHRRGGPPSAGHRRRVRRRVGFARDERLRHRGARLRPDERDADPRRDRDRRRGPHARAILLARRHR